MKTLDLAFYGSDTLSVLLGHVPVGDHQRLLQLPLDKMESALRPLPLALGAAAAAGATRLGSQSDHGLQSRDVFDGALSDLACHRELGRTS